MNRRPMMSHRVTVGALFWAFIGIVCLTSPSCRAEEASDEENTETFTETEYEATEDDNGNGEDDDGGAQADSEYESANDVQQTDDSEEDEEVDRSAKTYGHQVETQHQEYYNQQPQYHSQPQYYQQQPQYYQPAPSYPAPTYYSKPKKQKKKKVYVPVFVPEKEKKKMKIISVDKGFFIQGGTQLFGKFKSLKHCMKACAVTPACLAGDFNPWLHKCYQHTNYTACDRLRAHPQYVHFSKVPCSVVDAPVGRVTLGASMANGIEQKGIDNLQQCIKKCALAGGGVQPTATIPTSFNNQACFAIDYDFSTHKCYFFGVNYVVSLSPLPVIFYLHCPVAATTLPSSQGTRPNPNVVHITFCPVPSGYLLG